MRILPALGGAVLTTELDRSLARLTDALAQSGRGETAAAVRTAWTSFAESVGRLGSAATHVPAP
ncbi:MAG TPA: hypothetical protein VNI55_09465 [Gaiellaceae bacterium]|nr:hypothetical protein [Gaiellaceae bacterium]